MGPYDHAKYVSFSSVYVILGNIPLVLQIYMVSPE